MGTSQPHVDDIHLNKLSSYYTSKTVACASICGDGFRTPEEACDNGNKVGCTNCKIDQWYSCPVNSVGFLSVCGPILGDGYKTADEQCDNKNQPGCTNGKIDIGYVCEVDANQLSTCKTVCGDAIRIGTEQCDNGNKTGCATDCKPDLGYYCNQPDPAGPSICSSKCGDAIRVGT